ncbi:hypothetical protein KAURM247S_04289 [Kitasatospora aureofaciens]
MAGAPRAIEANRHRVAHCEDSGTREVRTLARQYATRQPLFSAWYGTYRNTNCGPS